MLAGVPVSMEKQIYVFPLAQFDIIIYLQVSTAENIISQFSGDQADLVVCDGAPDGKSVTNTILYSILYENDYNFISQKNLFCLNIFCLNVSFNAFELFN